MIRPWWRKARGPVGENVRLVVIDMSDPYKRFAKTFFPNARLVADKFHVLRLLHPAISRWRAEAYGKGPRAARARKLLLCSRHRLDFYSKLEVRDFLAGHPELRELKAELVKRRAFGYRSFRNYRLRLLNSCGH